MLCRLQWYTRAHEWFSTNQHGFRDGMSTERAGQALVCFIETSFQRKHMVASAFLDIKSAFDAAWHPAILTNLINRDCPMYLVRVISCFLGDCTAVLSHNGAKLSLTINLGCPQGRCSLSISLVSINWWHSASVFSIPELYSGVCRWSQNRHLPQRSCTSHPEPPTCVRQRLFLLFGNET